MKKLVAALLILASAVSLASCSVKKKDLTYEERQASLAARESEKVAESLKVESEIAEEMSELEDEIGKTVKGKKIVVKSEYTDRTEYTVSLFDKKQNISSRKIYMYFNNEDDYKVVRDNKGLREDMKLVKKDEKSRLLVFEYRELSEATFDDWYQTYQARGFNIIE